MISKTVTLPELGMIAGTRALFGAGLGLLLAGRIDPPQRRAVGWTLLAVGALMTIPLAAEVLFRDESESATEPDSTRAHRREMASTVD